MRVMQQVNSFRVVLKPMGVACLLLALTVPTGLVIAQRSRTTTAATTSSSPVTASVSGAAPTTATAPTDALLPTALDGWQLDANAPAQATKELLSDPTVPNLEKRIVRAHVTAIQPDQFWQVQFKHMVSRAIPEGTPLVLRFIARSPSRNQVNVAFLLNSGDYPKDLSVPIDLTPNWKVYTFPFTTKRAYRPDDAAVILHLGKTTGDIDLAALQVYPAGHVPD